MSQNDKEMADFIAGCKEDEKRYNEASEEEKRKMEENFLVEDLTHMK